jgi:hypothetical protein
MKPSVIVWDLETVPDLGGFAAVNDLVGKSDVDRRRVPVKVPGWRQRTNVWQKATNPPREAKRLRSDPLIQRE